MLGMALLNDKKAEIGLNVFRDVARLFKTTKTSSLIDYTQPARVEPVVLIDADMILYDNLTPIMQSLLSIFSGYYLQAVTLSMNVGAVNVLKTLDKLNPRRDPTDAFITAESGWMFAEESYQFGLPTYSAESQQVSLEADYMVMPLRLSMEAKKNFLPPHVNRQPAIDVSHHTSGGGSGDDRNRQHYDNLDQRERHHEDKMAAQRTQHADQLAQRAKERADRLLEGNRKHQLEKDRMDLQDLQHREKLAADKEKGKKPVVQTAEVGSETLKTVKELANLSVGKLLSVEVSDGTAKQSVLVNVRLIATTLPTEAVVHALGDSQQDIGWKARWHGWRSGRLEFWKDLIWMQDLIDQHRAHLMADKDGLFRSILGTQRKNQLASLLSGRLSVATASNMAVISEETAQKIEYTARMSLSNPKQRQTLMEPTALMLLCVVSKSFGMVKFYYRGIPEASELSIADLKGAAKGNGPDVGEIIKSFVMGSPPRL